MSTMEALLSATAWGGPMMKMGKQLGYIREGCLADILLIDGDPLADITVLQDKARILAVMKDGEFHRAPPLRGARVSTTPGATTTVGRMNNDVLFTNVRILDGTGRATRTPAACWSRATASARSAAAPRPSRRPAPP